jgi:hypothetical protein
MGRWAEVYFTSPPEKREQAVADLLRELVGASTAEPTPQTVDSEKSAKTEKTRYEPPVALQSQVEPEVTCTACAYNNPTGQRFCGMCGAPLQTTPEQDRTETPRTEPIAEARWYEPELSSDPNSADYEISQRDSFIAERTHSEFDSAWPPPQNDIPRFAMEPEPVPYRYRLYVGIVLAILLTALLYMAWRGSTALSGSQSPPSRVMPASPPSSPSAEQPPTRGRNNNNNVVPVEGPPSQKKTGAPVEKAEKIENPLEQRAQSAKQSNAGSQKQQTVSRVASQEAPVAASSAAPALEQRSAQDLATAEKYLYGTPGTSRDSKEAVQWLWKAVGKGNPTATILLSDLYLRGDGVNKNCDQARLLLDAGARKGVKGAGERLRNLQAFGCR